MNQKITKQASYFNHARRVFAICMMLSLFSFGALAQNLALTATFSHTVGGATTYGPQNYNDQINVSGTFGWALGSGASCYFMADWGTTTVNIDTIRVFPDNATSRTLIGADVQYWDGTAWVTHYTYTVPGALMYNIILPSTMTTTRMRLINCVVIGTNPSVREIEIYGNSTKGTNNLGITEITPSYPCAGINDIKVNVKNYGKNIVNDFKVNWTINGVAQTPYNYTSTPLDTNKGTGINSVTLTLGQHSFISNKKDTIKAWTTAPNGGVDTINNNDTVRLIKKPSLSGTFTVGGVGANYATLSAAFADLASFGVCGPVVLNCASNTTFTGHVEIATIPGANAVNNIKVNGNGSTITHNTPATDDRSTVRFNGGSWVTLDNFKINATGTTYGWAVHILNSSNNTVKNCDITVGNLTSSNIIPVVISGSETSYTTATTGSGNRVESCDLKGGYMGCGVYASGNTAKENIVTKNHIHNFYVYGVYYVGGTDGEVSYNNIHRDDWTGTITTFYGIYINGNTANTKVIGNKVHDSYPTGNTTNFTSIAIYNVTQSGLNSSNGVVIANNLIYNTVGYGTTTNYGIYNANSYYTRIYNNTILMNRTNTSGDRYAIATRLSGTEVGEDIRNNNIVLTGNNTSVKYGVFVGPQNIGNAPTIDNNNVYSSGANTFWGAWGGAGGATLQDWNELNSNMFSANIEVNPLFRDPATGNYEPKDARLNGAGNTNNALVPFDINLVSRGVSKLDIGAYNMDCDFGITSFTLPNATECELYTPQINVIIKNFSSKEYVNVPVGVRVGNDQVNNVASLTLAASASGPYTYGDSYTFKNAGTYKIKVFPLNDAVLANDTQSFDITILPAPRGSKLTQGSVFKGTMRSGTPTDFDVTAAGDEVTYNISTPSGSFSTANYGSAWSIPARVETLSGILLPASAINVTAPNGSASAIVSVIPPKAFVDSILKVIIPVKDLGNGCDSSIVRYVFVAPIPFVNFSAPGVCDGDGISFNNLSTISSGTMEYLWDFGTTPPAPTNFTSPVVKYNNAGIYNVKLTATSNWGYKHDTIIKVEIFEAPDVKFRPINACEGSAVMFQNNTSVSSGTIQYTWDFGDGTPANNTATPNHSYPTAGEYIVTLTADANGCTRSLTKSAFQFPQPVADFTVSGGDCNQKEVEFTNNSTLSFGSLGSLWDFGDLTYNTEKNATHAFKTAGVQDVTLRVTTQFGCQDVITKQVTLKESPIADFTNTQTCDIDPVDFTNTSFVPSGSNVDYTWTFGDPTSATNTSNLTNPSHKYSLPGKRIVTLHAEGDNGCENTISKEIVIGVQPQANFSAEAGCTGESVKFNNQTTISRGDIEVTYDWSFGSDEISPDNIFTTPGSQMVTLTATAVDGGCTDQITKEVIIGETPSCDFTTKTTGHFDVKFEPVTNNANYSYKWLFGDGGFSSEVSPTYQYSFNTVHFVKLTVTTPEGCECSKTTLNKTTSVGDVNFAERVSVYPNPNTGKFTIAVDGELEKGVTINVYNSLGAVVAVVNTDQSIDGTYSVDLGNVAAGVYTVKFTSATAVYTHKVTVTK